MAELTENLLRLKLVRGLGNALLWRLLQHFGNSDRLLGASETEIRRVDGMSRDKTALVYSALDIDPRPEIEKAVDAGVDIIPYDDPGYPKPLLHSYDPPAILYVRGTLTQADQVAIGIVGTRHFSQYGKQYAVSLSSALARGGYTVVSGLARGIDTHAHIGALDAGGRTVGVMGCGFDYIYPAENRDLALEMTRSGAVVTEFPMATSPSRETFPARNRIIAAMSLGVVVVEAPLRSGALITARLANDIGRSVFAVPGRMGDATSEGCNKLIRDGAVMITSVDDIFRELNPSLPPLPEKPARRRAGNSVKPAKPVKPVEGELFATPPPQPAPPAQPTQSQSRSASSDLNADEKTGLSLQDYERRGQDAIIDSTGLPGGAVIAALSRLRISRLAEQAPGQLYRLREGE